MLSSPVRVAEELEVHDSTPGVNVLPRAARMPKGSSSISFISTENSSLLNPSVRVDASPRNLLSHTWRLSQSAKLHNRHVTWLRPAQCTSSAVNFQMYKKVIILHYSLYKGMYSCGLEPRDLYCAQHSKMVQLSLRDSTSAMIVLLRLRQTKRFERWCGGGERGGSCGG
jgi:hypothetical protein